MLKLVFFEKNWMLKKNDMTILVFVNYPKSGNNTSESNASGTSILLDASLSSFFLALDEIGCSFGYVISVTMSYVRHTRIIKLRL